MTKKAVSTSNVPHTGSKTNANNNNSNIHSNNNNTNNNSNHKSKSPQKQHNSQSVLQNTSILNSKHVHSSTLLQPNRQKPKNNRETSGANGNDNNILMKKLFEAVQKQKEKEQPILSGSSVGHEREGRRSRKPSAPLPKPLSSSENYAGAAFDRAPSATSFPIPSFIKTAKEDECAPNFSSSCPLPGGIDPLKSSKDSEKVSSKNQVAQVNPGVKSLSINDLFKSTESKVQVNNEKAKLESVTNDLRRMLNL